MLQYDRFPDSPSYSLSDGLTLIDSVTAVSFGAAAVPLPHCLVVSLFWLIEG